MNTLDKDLIKIVVILSGGMDSVTLLHDLHQRGHELVAVSFNYGQKHSRELECARRNCEKLGVFHKIVEFPDSMKDLFKGSSLMDADQEIPEGHYAAENMKSTVVPNRNMIMLSLATGYAISTEAQAVAYAAHSGDHDIYPDCRPDFAAAVAQAMRFCHFNDGIQLWAPYMWVTKNDIAALGVKLGVPYGDTWTCYNGREKPCGVCGACVERAEAFAFANTVDPLIGGD